MVVIIRNEKKLLNHGRHGVKTKTEVVKRGNKRYGKDATLRRMEYMCPINNHHLSITKDILVSRKYAV